MLTIDEECPSSVQTTSPVSGSQNRTVLSPAKAIVRPSGDHATQLRSSECTSRVRRLLPVSGSHSRTVWSGDAEASRLPSGDHVTLVTRSVCPSRVRRLWPVTGSQSCTVRSYDAVAILRPSGDHATLITPPVCPSSVRTNSPEDAFQMRIVLSVDGDASHLPSGDQAIRPIKAISRAVRSNPRSVCWSVTPGTGCQPGSPGFAIRFLFAIAVPRRVVSRFTLPSYTHSLRRRIRLTASRALRSQPKKRP